MSTDLAALIAQIEAEAAAAGPVGLADLARVRAFFASAAGQVRQTKECGLRSTHLDCSSACDGPTAGPCAVAAALRQSSSATDQAAAGQPDLP